MTRLLSAAVLLAAALTADAHFVFVVPDAKDAGKALVVLSDELAVDDAVTTEKLGGLKLSARDSSGKTADVALVKEKHSFNATVPGTGPRVVFGSVNYGVMQKGDAKPFLLAYHPKAVVGATPADGGNVGTALPAELIPVVGKGKVKFQLVAGGKLVADAEATVLLPGGGSEKAKTDKDGFTKEFDKPGRYGAWVRHAEAKAGEHDGKKYEEVRHYATLVVDVPAK